MCKFKVGGGLLTGVVNILVPHGIVKGGEWEVKRSYFLHESSTFMFFPASNENFQQKKNFYF